MARLFFIEMPLVDGEARRHASVHCIVLDAMLRQPAHLSQGFVDARYASVEFATDVDQLLIHYGRPLPLGGGAAVRASCGA
jgi:hypothetical protein